MAEIAAPGTVPIPANVMTSEPDAEGRRRLIPLSGTL